MGPSFASVIASAVPASGATASYNAVSGWSGSKYLSRTPGSTGSQRTFTISMWVQRSSTGSTQYLFVSEVSGSGDIAWVFFNASNQIQLYINGGGTSWISTETFTSTSAWYHLVFAYDTTQATDSNRIKVYSNGVQLTAGTANYYALNTDVKINTASYTFHLAHYTTTALAGKVAHVHLIDGAQLTPTSFSQAGSGGTTVPEAYTGSYGTNGWLMDFANSSDIGNDVSGNNRDMTVTGLTSGDVSAETVSY